MATIDSVKMSLRVTTPAFDTEITELINAAVADLGIAGVTNINEADPLILRAITTYVRLHFGQPDDYDRLKRSYDEQKAQLGMATGHTEWVVNG